MYNLHIHIPDISVTEGNILDEPLYILYIVYIIYLFRLEHHLTNCTQRLHANVPGEDVTRCRATFDLFVEADRKRHLWCLIVQSVHR